MKNIQIVKTDSGFEREPLRFPFGFKGGYLTELWQAVSRIQSASGHSGIGIATQSVLYGDADLFSMNNEAAGNALMFLVTNKALELMRQTTFQSPIELLDRIFPVLFEEAKVLTAKADLNPNFVYNALVSADNAIWLVYAAENGYTDYDSMIPETYRPALGYRNDRIGIMFQVSYDMPAEQIMQAVSDGYFIFKIKTGYPGDQKTMLEGDKKRLKDIHDLLKDVRTKETDDGRLIYTMDANGRYETKATFVQYLDYAKKIGALGQILFYEEPMAEDNDDYMGDLGVRVAADESVYDVASAERRIQQGYQAIVLKSVAKTLSQTLKILEYAHRHNVPCSCSDLTINPVLLEWHRNFAARLQPFPETGMVLMETNGASNYVNWQTMQRYHPMYGAPWTAQKAGKFQLGDEFYEKSGGLFLPLPHYQAMFTR
ncbi:enolase C-terminal domain-like protein [Parapedobacter sp. 10938]|uniref:enolase C-terminal domain-like protein n=1 Tax=Parapedobacter flavus TaxID=3110225 RepID=UPI002DBCDDB3|nr:enolase C-terminal domain-like protein [Parapedobacter sp. 10938]MEC3878317.1 enolase C-terminal domain-like protein [Parapedobacter sp. 10938]